MGVTRCQLMRQTGHLLQIRSALREKKIYIESPKEPKPLQVISEKKLDAPRHITPPLSTRPLSIITIPQWVKTLFAVGAGLFCREPLISLSYFKFTLAKHMRPP